ncbi:MAG: RraA family protein [Candidatus Kariarchaeaceae archaeon]|jgi:regulator of RNase E activity RraA
MSLNKDVVKKFEDLYTPHIADALVRQKLPLRIIGNGINPIMENTKIVGKVLPVQHFGSVDIFFEMMELANKGDILVIDNNQRTDEGCVGDLTALEARSAGIIGFIVNGFNRDTTDLRKMNFPVFSYGSISLGPTRSDDRTADAMQIARFGDIIATSNDYVFADDDGVIFVAEAHLESTLDIATSVRTQERMQAQKISDGENMRKQLQFEKFMEKKQMNPNYTFREHLREIGGAIEE